MKSGFKLVLMTLPLVAVGVGFVAFTIATKPAPAQEEIAERATAVRVITATTTAVSPTVSGFGLVAPARTFEAIPQVSGTAEYVNPMLKKGDILPEGALLVRLSASDYTLAIAQAKANIRAAEAKLAEIAVSGENLKAAMKIEEDTLALKASDLERVERLFSAGTASQSARDNAKAVYLAQQQKLQNLQSSLALLPTQKLVQTEQIAVYKATLATAELNLARTELRLPFAARVSMVNVEVGQLVRTGVSVASFDGIAAAKIEAQVPAADLLRLFRPKSSDAPVIALNPSAMSEVMSGLDLKATVQLKLGDTLVEWPATLDRISNTIDPKTGTVGMIVRVDNAYTGAELGRRPPLTKGMFVKATLNARPVDGIVIPRSALRGGQLMIANTDSRLELRPITPYLVQDGIALITDGVENGEKIVVSTPVPMIEGMLLSQHPDTALMKILANVDSAK
ncbi:efflux RND transporter periplasmic adaptor subunit [Profundibacter sp.]|uniref:efflux RND transporter periplasmic adaptor subunit n=1 Tax=Profundibacter sp. TaxID=3101071 RepID=UPI003D0B6FAD